MNRAPAGPRQRGPLALAAAVGATAKIVVLAPATQVLLAEPDLPPGSGAKLARAVPFALEEQLTEDIDHLYFAIGRRGPSRQDSGCGGVARDHRRLARDARRRGITPVAIYPDIS
jgi:general secretion pathway protein L